jgi:hypothetical protein
LSPLLLLVPLPPPLLLLVLWRAVELPHLRAWRNTIPWLLWFYNS